MRSYTTVSILASLVFIGFSLFYFLNDDEYYGRLFLLITMIAFFGIYYFLKTLYYLKYQATFNELSFVVLFPFIPLLQTVFKSMVIDSSLSAYDVLLIGRNTLHLYADFTDILAIPYYFFSVFLILRTHLRYPFIRPRGHSDGGLPPRLIAFILLLAIPPVYFIAGLIFFNALFILYSIIFSIVCLIGFFV